MHRLNVALSIAAASVALLAAGFDSPAQAQTGNSALNRWTQSAALSAPRAQACAAVLNDGRLLVVGGVGASGAVAAVDVYGTDGSFNPGVPMTQARANAACVTMTDGRVLVTGGNGGTGSLNSAEVFDPVQNKWMPTGNLNFAREGHRMSVTAWGVWIAGGTNNGSINGSLELFSPATGQFTAVGALNTPRTEFAMAAQGRKLIIAGGTDGANTLSSVEVYDGALGSITVAGSMAQPRKDFAAAALLDGTILMTGGVDVNGALLSSTEFFDPVKGTSTPGPALLTARSNHTAYAMPNNGSVLIYGGSGFSGILDSTEVYTPWNGAIAQGTPLNEARRDEARATLHAGHYLVAGGRNDAGLISDSELFQFSTISTDKADYAPGTAVKVSGAGWIPGEQVLVTITAYPLDQHHVEFTGAGLADGNGNIAVPGFAVDKSHLGMKFLMTAIGSQSEAETTFTDGLDPTFQYQFSPSSGTTTGGQPVTVTITVFPNPLGTGPQPTGTIAIWTNGALTNLTISGAGCTNSNKQCTLSAGVNNTATATVTLSSIPAGTTTFSVQYTGDSNYNPEVPGGNAPVASYMAQFQTITDLAGPQTTSYAYGNEGPYVANVCISSNGTTCDLSAGTLSGSVQFLVNGVNYGTPVPIVANPANGTGSASMVPGTNPAGSAQLAVGGPYTITAQYANDTNNTTSNSSAANGGFASLSTTITKATTTIAITATNLPEGGGTFAYVGDTVTLTAVVTATNVTPTGTVSITPPAGTTTTTCGAALTSSSTTANSATYTCTFKVAVPAGGVPQTGTTVTASASYAGDTNTQTSGPATSPAIPIQQDPTTTTISITSGDSPAATFIGHTATISVTVSTTNNVQPNASAIAITPPAGNSANSSCATPTAGASTANSVTVSCSFLVTGPLGTGTIFATANYGGGTGGAGDSGTGTAGSSVTGTLAIRDAATTISSFTATSPDSPAATFVGHTVTLTTTVTTTTTGAVLPNGNPIPPTAADVVFTLPPGNTANSTCTAAGWTASVNAPTGVLTVSCTFLVTGSSPLPASISPSVAYNGDNTVGTAAASNNPQSATVNIALDTTAITSVTQASDNSPAATEIGRTVTITVTVANQVTGAVLPNGSAILPTPADVVITPPAGNSSNSSCGAPTQTGTGANSITVKCTYLLTGPLVASVTASASYTGDANTAASGPVTSAALTVTKAVTTIPAASFTVSSLDGSTNIQFGRTVTLTATVQTQNNGTGVELGPTGSFTFVLQPGSFYPSSLPSCGGATAMVTPTAGQITVTTPYTGIANQGTATVTCQFTLVPVSAANSLSPDTFKVTYNGDGLTQASNQATVTVTPVLAATQLTASASSATNSGVSSIPGCPVSNSAYNFVYGQPFTLTGTLSDPLTSLSAIGTPPTYPPTKSVTFSGGGFTYSAPIVANPAGGTATANVPPPTTLVPPVGCYTMNVNYPTPAADPYYAASSTSITFRVAQASTMTTITKLTTTLAGQPDILVTVVPVAPGAGSPTGTIQIIVGNSASGPVFANAPLVPASGSACGGAAACSTASFVLPGGTYGAVYPGDSNFLGSNTFTGPSAVPTPVVTSSSITLSYAANNSTVYSAVPPVVQVGGTISIQATVTGTNGSAQPTGSVTFYDNGNLIGVEPVVQGGLATLPSFTPQPGANSILVSYSGDSTYPPFTISAGFNVTKITVQVTPDIPATATAGQSVTLSVRLAGPTQGAALPTGTVTFFDNGAQIGTPATISNGVATLTLSSGLSAGQNNISINYSGDSNYASVTQNIGAINVGAAQPLTTTTTLTVTVSGAQMTLTATVAPSGSATGTPTGTVQFVDSITGAVLATATLSNGTATVTIPLTTDSIVAIYSGDSTFMSSTSAASETISVTNAASYVQAFSPGEIATVFGSNLATQTITGSLPLTNSLGGVTVTVTDSAGVVRPADLFYVSPSQLSFLIPPAAALGTATVTVTTANGSLTSSINLTASTSALFTANANGKGPLAAQVFDYPPNGSQPTYVDTATLSGTTFVNAPISLTPTTDSFYLYLYGTGFDNAKSVTVTINGQTFTPAYFGPQGTYAGLDQINVLLPQSLANSGQVNVSITVDGQVSNVGTIQFGSGGTN